MPEKLSDAIFRLKVTSDNRHKQLLDDFSPREAKVVGKVVPILQGNVQYLEYLNKMYHIFQQDYHTGHEELTMSQERLAKIFSCANTLIETTLAHLNYPLLQSWSHVCGGDAEYNNKSITELDTIRRNQLALNLLLRGAEGEGSGWFRKVHEDTQHGYKMTAGQMGEFLAGWIFQLHHGTSMGAVGDGASAAEEPPKVKMSQSQRDQISSWMATVQEAIDEEAIDMVRIL